MTEQEKQEIISAVLSAIRTNSKTISQLTSVSEMSDDDNLELNGGRKVSYGVLFANHQSKGEANEALQYIDTKKVDKDSRGLVEVHQAPVVFLDAMGSLDGHTLNGNLGLEYRTTTKLIYDFPGGKFDAPKTGAVYISKNNFKKFVWNGTDLEELKADECPLFVDYSEPVSFATLPVGGSYYVPSSHKIAVKIDASNTKTYDPLPDALYFFRDKGKVYTWNSSTNKWVPLSSDIKVINDLTTGGEGDALSAEMGKILKTNIEFVNSKVNTLLNALANIAFKQLPKPEMTELDWGENTPSLTSPQNGAEVNVGTIPSDGTSVTKAITIKGKNLESAVNLAISGTGFSLSANSVSAADANAGTTVTVTYTDNGTGDGLDKTGTLTISSAGSEFTQRTVSLKAKKLAPGVVEPVVSLAPNDHLELTGSLSDGTYSGVLTVKSASASTKGLPWAEDISAVMGGASKAITYNDSTGAITISGVTADVTITAVASVVDGVDYQNNPIRWKEGLYFNGNGSYDNQGDNTSTDAEWCISDFVKCDWNNLSIGNLMFGTGVGNITNHYIIFYDENKQYHSRLSLNTAYRLYDLSNNTGIVYFRTSMLISKRSTRIIRDLTNERFLLKGSDYDGRYDDLVYGIAHIAPSNTPTDYQSDSHAVTQALPVNFGPGETITFWCGSLQNINGSYPYLFFYSQESIDLQYQTAKLSCNAEPRSWGNSSSDTHPYASITLFLESIDDCYCKVTRNGADTFYFAGFNVDTNGNA